MRFITNFDAEKMAIYLEAVKRHGDYELVISPLARNQQSNHMWPNTGSLWDAAPMRRDLSDFWQVFDKVRKEMTTVI